MENNKLKIVLLTNILTPYRKYFYDNLFDEMKKRGHCFSVVCMAKTESNRVWNFEDYRSDYCILLESRTISVGGIYFHINTGIKRIMSELSPDIVICSGSYLLPAIWQTIYYKKKYQYKLIFWSESHLDELRDYGKIKLAVREILRKRILCKFDAYWIAGKLSKQFVEKYALNTTHYIFVPNIIDDKEFDKVNQISDEDRELIKKKNGICLDKKIFLIVARLSKVKGIGKFLELLLNAENSDEVECVIVGEGELRNELEIYCRDNNMDVIFIGQKEQKEMLEFYAIADAFVLPSISDPNPLSCIEACWCSLPLFVSENVGNHPELVVENENGYVFSYGDFSDSVKKLQRIIDNSEEWYINGRKKSYEIAEAMYSSKKAIERIVNETLLLNVNNHL